MLNLFSLGVRASSCAMDPKKCVVCVGVSRKPAFDILSNGGKKAKAEGKKLKEMRRKIFLLYFFRFFTFPFIFFLNIFPYDDDMENCVVG